MSAAEPMISTPVNQAPPVAPATTPAPAAAPTPAAQAGVPELRGLPNPGTAPVAPPAPAETVPAWAKDFSSDDLAYIQSKGWHKEGKGPGDILQSYRNLERLRGVAADKLVKLPDWNKADEVAEFRGRIGVPADVKAYEHHDVAMPLGSLDADRVAGISHAIGLTQAQHAAFLDETGRYFTEAFQAQEVEIARRNAAELAELKQEWGANFDAHNQAAHSAIAQVGITEDELGALKVSLGEAGTRKLLARMGTLMGEHTRPNGATTGAPMLMTADVAKAQIAELKNDQGFYKRMESGDVHARKQWDELHRIAFSD